MGGFRIPVSTNAIQRQQYRPCLIVVSVDEPAKNKQVFIVTIKMQQWLSLCTVVELPNISYSSQQ